MDEALAQRLVDLTRDFYAGNASSFSETRQAPWAGWDRVLEEVRFMANDVTGTLRIADIGCGNLRFEKMLLERCEDADNAPCNFDIVCVDNNAAFLEEAHRLRERAGNRISIETFCADIVESIIADEPSALSSIRDRDLVVCFAVMHHIPLTSWREELFDALVDMAASGGYIALSFWCFSRDERLLGKAHAATDTAEAKLRVRLDRTAGDYLMGWRDEQDSWRYCHDFTDDDINVMVGSRVRRCGDIEEVARFAADGRCGNLNEYLILKKR